MHLYEAIVVIISLIERYLSQANHRAVGRSSPSSIIVWPIILIRSSSYGAGQRSDFLVSGREFLQVKC